MTNNIAQSWKRLEYPELDVEAFRIELVIDRYSAGKVVLALSRMGHEGLIACEIEAYAYRVFDEHGLDNVGVPDCYGVFLAEESGFKDWARRAAENADFVGDQTRHIHIMSDGQIFDYLGAEPKLQHVSDDYFAKILFGD